MMGAPPPYPGVTPNLPPYPVPQAETNGHATNSEGEKLTILSLLNWR